jgi:hypothetical protein
VGQLYLLYEGNIINHVLLYAVECKFIFRNCTQPSVSTGDLAMPADLPIDLHLHHPNMKGNYGSLHSIVQPIIALFSYFYCISSLFGQKSRSSQHNICNDVFCFLQDNNSKALLFLEAT